MSVKPKAMRDAFLARVCQGMKDDDRIFFVTADFGSPVLDLIRAEFPERFINVGVAEQNLINVSAGLALEGFTVFAYAIAPFITMRCFEQVRVSLALLSQVREMNVNLVGVGAGFSYIVSGPTHQCFEDLTIMRSLPTMAIYSPADHLTAENLFDRCVARTGPKYLRFDAQVLPPVYPEGGPDLDPGFFVHARGKRVCLVATGYMVHTALAIANSLQTQGQQVGVIDLFDLTGFDRDRLRGELSGYDAVFSMEEGFSGRGGLDAMLYDYVAHEGLELAVHNVGITGSHRFELGTREELHAKCGIGVAAVESSVRRVLAAT